MANNDRKEKRRRRKMNVSIVMAVAIALVGSVKYIGSYVTVSSNVNGKELPIYCVQTDEKKVALSFDAAWGNVR